MPMSLYLGVLGIGILLLWMRRRIGVAKIVLRLGFLALTALSFTAVANQIIKPLELWYPSLLDIIGMEDRVMGDAKNGITYFLCPEFLEDVFFQVLDGLTVMLR